MPVTEADRHKLYESLKTTLGETEAETFMNLLPPSEWSEIAKKRDLTDLGAALRSEMADLGAALRSEMADLGAALRGEMADLGAALRGEMADLRGELRGEMADLRGEMSAMESRLTRTVVTWLLASQTVVIAVVAVLVSALA